MTPPVRPAPDANCGRRPPGGLPDADCGRRPPGGLPDVVKGRALAESDRATERQARLAALFGQHFDFIWRLLRRVGVSRAEVDDAAQQVFMVATRKIDAIAVGSERTFLYGTALRIAANMRRGARRRRELPEAAIDARPAFGAAPDHQAELRRTCDLLDELLERLSPELRRVLVLAEIEQLEVAEIAALERIPVGTAASRLRRARARFREELARAPGRSPFGDETP